LDFQTELVSKNPL